MRLDVEPSAGDPFQPDGEFDGITARHLEALLLHAPAGTRFLVDLTRVGILHDFALAVLAHALSRTGADVTVRGLRAEHVQRLRSSGVDTERLERAAALPRWP